MILVTWTQDIKMEIYSLYLPVFHNVIGAEEWYQSTKLETLRQLKTSIGKVILILDCWKIASLCSAPLCGEMFSFQNRNSSRSLKPSLHKPSEFERKGFSSACIYSSCLSNKEGEQTCSSSDWTNLNNETTDKEGCKDRWIQHSTAWRSLSTRWLLRSPGLLWERSSSYSVSHCLSFPIWGSHFSPSSFLLHDNPFHSPLYGFIITSSTSDPGFYKFPWYQSPWPLMWKILSSIHISGEFLRSESVK